MNRFSLSHLAAATMVVSVSLMVGSILTVYPTPSQAAKGEKGGGGGQQPTPAMITFDDSAGQKIWSDEGPFIDGIPPGLKVKIAAKANYVNIGFDGDNFNRTLRITVPANECGLPPGETGPPLASDFDALFLRVDVNKEVSGGVFGLDETGPGSFAMVPMRIGFGHPVMGGDLFFLKFNFKGPGPCKGKSGPVTVTRTSSTSWTVTNDGSACVEKHTTDTGQADFCFVDEDMKFSFVVDLL